MSTQATPQALFEKRKRDHIELALLDKNQSVSRDIESIRLIHEALPDMNFSDVNLQINSLGSLLPSPYFVSSMTAGHAGSVNINRVLAEACAKTGWAMGVGSQRRELMDAKASEEWQTIRKQIPDVMLYGNIGIAQTITHSSEEILNLCNNLQAKALFIHCNPLQECIQPEGTPQFSGCYRTIETLCKHLPLPIVIKETGCGFSKTTLEKLKTCGVAAVDMSGFGGTHWGRIEGDRANSELLKNTAESFKHWGISTLQSLLNARAVNPSYELWASGGVRSGLDAAKYLALGANRIGIAKPMLQSALSGVDSVLETMSRFEYELKTALFCTGSSTITQLREAHRWQLMM